MKFVRWVLGRIILIVDFLTRPKFLVREQDAQAKVDEVTANMSIYQFKACPFCVKVRRQLRRQGLNIELRDAKENMTHKEELTQQGGRHKVPCLRIDQDGAETEWLYESKEIISYLEKKFAA
ncbi:glutaredoxin [Terasakiella sp. A23]|uniref:glutaredoxin family protein n=1 Tax=Terasakiella sp. FCG-A23 TaxID=3080561 RepID=UPI002952C644|nr:glutaredoxin [Terasakiella sp. A23]MDV7338098.1 glutaredoxin [Terasakiella sp. A23]